MLNMIKTIIVALIFASCSNNAIKPVPSDLPDIPTALPEDSIKIVINDISGFTEAQKDHVSKAALVCELAINTDKFKNEFLHLSFNTQDNKGLTNIEIYKELASGLNNFEKVADSTINLYLEAYRTTLPTSKALAYTTASTQKIYLNTRVLLSRDICSVCGTLIHEYAHNLGYGHPVKARWGTSVPYMSGDLAQESCNSLSK